ncbi:MAG: SRPBCC family protein [Chthoniobacterales bacterium]
MRCFFPPTQYLLRVALMVCAGLLQPSLEADDNVPGAVWTQEANADGVLIQSRIHGDSQLREFKGTGVIDAAPTTVFAVLDDSESYPRFMPYISECHVLKREKDTVVAYQRLDFPLVSDRDYTVRSHHSKWLGPDGPIYRIRWEAANDEGPAKRPGVQRVNICQGGWLLEPEGDNATRATYSIYTDSGGALPTFVANNGSRIAIRKLFEAIRKRVKNPKYASARPVASDTSTK